MWIATYGIKANIFWECRSEPGEPIFFECLSGSHFAWTQAMLEMKASDPTPPPMVLVPTRPGPSNRRGTGGGRARGPPRGPRPRGHVLSSARTRASAVRVPRPASLDAALALVRRPTGRDARLVRYKARNAPLLAGKDPGATATSC